MVELWTSETPAFEGPTIRFSNIAFAPKPLQKPHIPLWFGGNAPPVLRRLARWGSGWSPQSVRPEAFLDTLDRVRSMRDYRGQEIRVNFLLANLSLLPDHAADTVDIAEIYHDRQRLIEQLGWLKTCGVDEVSPIRPTVSSIDEYCDWLQWVAEEIAPALE
jgi:alkanesulfonate monooxygenase SsuD/methylene tetrahydromethanopterin reductase-like flavin-dependent oxidoreductase (luciferase family)